MKKFLLSSFVVVTFAIYIAFQRLSGLNDIRITPPNLGSKSTTPSTSSGTTNNIVPTPHPAAPLYISDDEEEGGLVRPPTRTPANPPVQTPAPTPSQVTPSTGYRNGTYTGNVADAYYGNVQVKVVIQGGKITDVQFLDYPHDRSTSIMINTQAMPYLKQEAIQAQGANVDVVSGATATSGAFNESLASALAKAKN